MRRPTLFILVVLFAITWIIIISHLLAFIQLFFEHSGIPITQTEIALAHNASTTDPRPQLIPKIIHQIYHDWRHAGMPEDWEQVSKTCKDLNKNWEYKLWTESSSREFIKENYAWFLKTYDGYQYPVQRIDTVRYFLLLHYGGIYLDMDNGCLENMDAIIYYPTFTTDGGRGALSNNILASTPQHPFWVLLTQSLIPYNYNYFFPYITISYASGQWFLTSVWQKYHQQRRLLGYSIQNGQNDVNESTNWTDAPLYRVMMDNREGAAKWVYWTQERGGTWVHWDNYFFLWIGEHLVLLGMVVVGEVALAAWMILACVRRVSRAGLKSEYEAMKMAD